MTLLQVIGSLATGGAILGGIVSFLFERFGWFQSLTGKVRFWTIGALSIGLPVAAVLAVQYVPPEWWAWLEPLWKAGFAGGSAWLGGQIYHKFINKDAQVGLTASELLWRVLGQTNFLAHLAKVGARNVVSVGSLGLLTDSQAHAIDIYANDEQMQRHILAAQERANELEVLHGFNARPWINAQKL